jgi:hypothetical protein
MLNYDNADGLQSRSIGAAVPKMNGPESVNGFFGQLTCRSNRFAMDGYIIIVAQRGPEPLSAVHHEESGRNSFLAVLMRVSVKRIEIPQSVQSSLSMLGPDRFKFNSDLDNDWGRHCDRLASFRSDGSAGACTYRDVDNPIGMADLLVMPQLCNDFSFRCSLADKWTLGNKVANDDKRLKIAVF